MTPSSPSVRLKELLENMDSLWRQYIMNWKPGMPIIGYPIESQGQISVLTYLQWLIQNSRVFELANPAFHFQRCGIQQNFLDVQRGCHTGNAHHRERAGKKKSMREILMEHWDEVAEQNERTT